jgi:CelD/BcsL family acetyltransferase involved in cellulose biosynthesis
VKARTTIPETAGAPAPALTHPVTLVLSFDALAPRHLAAWHGMVAANPDLASPYFHPGFARAVHAVHGDVRVVVTEQDGDVRSLLAVQVRGGIARPVGMPGSDFQGPIVPPGAVFAPLRALRPLGVRTLAFDHLVEGAVGFAPWVDRRVGSPFVDVAGGLEGYLGRASSGGRAKVSKAKRLTDKLSRDHGDVRFTAEATDPLLLDQLIELKREQYRSTGARDWFAGRGHRELLRTLLDTRADGFAGTLSTLHSGTRLVAAHFGIRSGGVLHWWFPVYDRDFAAYAPGWILLRQLIVGAEQLGLRRIDLGRGEDEYKRKAMTGSTDVAAGEVTVVPLRRQLRALGRAARRSVVTSPLGPPLRRAVHQLRHGSGRT